MGIFNTLSGFIRVELTSADLSGILHQMNRQRIPLFELQMIEDMTVQFKISRGDFAKVRKIVDRKGDLVKLVSDGGIFYILQRFINRPVLVFGAAFIFCMSLILPRHVMFFDVEGNESIPSRLILENASEIGIGFGASRRDVRSERMKNELLGMLPQLQWAGINTYGCRAVISVRERAIENREQMSEAISRIVASRDGVITSCVVTRGSGLCSVGQAVQKGQVLISGYTDCGGVMMTGHAEGEVFAQTRHEIAAIALPKVSERAQKCGSHVKYSLLIGKKRINLYKGSGISDASCVKMVSQYYLTLPGGYVIPLALIKEEFQTYQFQNQKCVMDDLPAKMSGFLQQLLRSDCVALSVIDAKETFDNTEGKISLTGIYSCIEMIGREQEAQLGDFKDETN